MKLRVLFSVKLVKIFLLSSKKIRQGSKSISRDLKATKQNYSTTWLMENMPLVHQKRQNRDANSIKNRSFTKALLVPFSRMKMQKLILYKMTSLKMKTVTFVLLIWFQLRWKVFHQLLNCPNKKLWKENKSVPHDQVLGLIILAAVLLPVW